MLRSLLIYLSKAAWAKQIITRWAFAWRAASRFVAGEKLEDALEAVNKLNKIGINATLDHLGEHTTNPDHANCATQDIIQILDMIQQSGIRSNVSIKLTQVGMALDYGLCVQNLTAILERAQKLGNFVRIDMEDASWVDTTLKLYREMYFDRSYHCVGIVIQSYLYRSHDDVTRLIERGARIRLCKGAYKEPPDVAYPKKRDVDTNYDQLARMIMDRALEYKSSSLSEDSRIPPHPAIATHDIQRIDNAISYAHQIGLPKNSIEFQMLYGIRRDIQIKLVSEGYPVRVYVPYGTEWYPYTVRRLAERPANLWFFISNLLRK